MTRSLGLVVAAYLVLALAYSLATPFGVPPDEGAHHGYVTTLAVQARLPRLDVALTNEQDPAGYEAHQPPLYYLLAAAGWKLAWLTGAGELGAVRAARFVSTLIGALGIVLIWWLVRLAAPGAPSALALAAAGFAALLPSRLHIYSSISNDCLTEAASTGVLCLLLLAHRDGLQPRRSGLLGLVLGAALLTKATSLLLLPVAGIGLILAVAGRQAAPPEEKRVRKKQREPEPAAAAPDWKALLLNAAITFGAAALVAGWWYGRNYLVYGDLLMEQTFRQKFRQALSASDAVRMFGYGDFGSYLLGVVSPATFDSFWGAFGHMEPRGFMGVLPSDALQGVPGWLLLLLAPLRFGVLPGPGYPPHSWLYPLLAALTWVCAAGCVRDYLRSRASAETHRAGLLLGAYALLVAAAFLRFNTEYFQAQGRYLFPALGPIALALAWGWLAWFPERWRRYAPAPLLLLMTVLSVYALVGVIVPGYTAR